ncbi:MAG: toprim domain-containing protein [Hydrogenophaga sp.]|nr:toprim domain-containing protein [Hydrogenophaga sp.]
MDNVHQVLHQMMEFGIELRDKDSRRFPVLSRRTTCGAGGKYWYKLYEFRPRAGGRFLVGSFGSYRSGKAEKVEVDWKPLGEAERERFRAEREAARKREAEARAEEARQAAMSAADLWASGARAGTSAYLASKGVAGESCRYLPDGSLLVPLLRYDMPREQALRAVQRIYPAPRKHPRTGEALPQKVFTKGFAKTGCSVRLGEIASDAPLLIVCEGYATGLSIRAAIEQRWPVFVALDAYNLAPVVELLHRLYPQTFILICADDDWLTADHQGPNPGRRAARVAAKQANECEIVWPVFAAATRAPKDTDFNDLHQREGLPVVQRQLQRVVGLILELMD